MKSLVKARGPSGIISADARCLWGVHHTVSVWTDRDAMRAYLTVGTHLADMRLFPMIATGKVFGYLADQAPDWSEVHAIWRERGRAVQRRNAPKPTCCIQFSWPGRPQKSDGYCQSE